MFRITPTYVFDYNSGVSWSIFIPYNFFTVFMTSLLCHPARHKVFVIGLLLNIKYIELWIEFEDKILIKKPVKCERFYARRLIKNFVQKKTIIRRLSAKVANNGFEQTHSRKRSATVVSKCDTSVETQLGWWCKFCWLLCKVFIPVSISSKSIKID